MRRAKLTLLLILLHPQDAARALTVGVTPILFAGDLAPGVVGGEFGPGVYGRVNDAGQVALSNRLAVGGQGLWTWEVATGGAPAPLLVPGPSPIGPAGAEISGAFLREITASGRVGWEATLRAGPGGVTSGNNSLLGSFATSEGHTVMAREGDPAPGMPGQTLILVAGDAIPDWNDAGEAVQTIGSFAVGPPLVFGGALYRFEPQLGLSPVYLPGDPVPGDPTRTLGGGVIHRINTAGDVAFAASTTTTPGGPGDATLFAPDGVGGFAAIARVGGQAPDAPLGATIRFFPGGGFFSLNDAGQMAFPADLVVGPGGVTGADDSGVWVAHGPTDITLRYRQGDPIPGSPGLFFGPLAGIPLLNGNGDLVLLAALQLGGGVSTLDDKILLVPDGAGDVMLLARENAPNPILPGEVWGGLTNVLSFSDSGALLFRASSGDGLSRFYHRDPSGALALITGQGMSVDLGGGDERTIDTFLEFDGSDDASRLLATTRFTDGSTGLILFTVPEPGTFLMVASGALLVGAVARAHRRG